MRDVLNWIQVNGGVLHVHYQEETSALLDVQAIHAVKANRSMLGLVIGNCLDILNKCNSDL